jgi:hypothetical protein
MCILYATPYNVDAIGFYFSSAGEFQDKVDKLRDHYGNPVEEFEIGYSDGDDPQLFEACGINQCNLATWFDDVESLDDHQKPALFYLCDANGYSLSDALDKLDDVCLYEGRLIDAASELFDECYAAEIPENLRFYIDYEAFARNCQLSGDMYEFELDGTTWTVTNASGV